VGFIIDLILVLAFVFSIVTAYKKGLLKSLLDAFGFIASVFLAFEIAEHTHLWVYETFFREGVTEAIRLKIAESAATETASQISLSFFETKEFLSAFASIVGLDIESITKNISGIDLSAENAAELLTEMTIQPIITVIIRCIMFFVMAVVFIVVLNVVIGCLTKVIKITPLNGINKFFGGVFGTLKGFVTVALLIVLTVLLAAVIENEFFDSMVRTSRVFEFLNTQSDIFKIN